MREISEIYRRTYRLARPVFGQVSRSITLRDSTYSFAHSLGSQLVFVRINASADGSNNKIVFEGASLDLSLSLSSFSRGIHWQSIGEAKNQQQQQLIELSFSLVNCWPEVGLECGRTKIT